MIIKNFEKLAHSYLRKQLLSIAEAGFAAINTTQAVKNSFQLKKDTLLVQKKKFGLKKFKRIFVLCFGKAALESSAVIKEVLGERVERGVVVDVAKTADKSARYTEGNWSYFQATHPNISEQNAEAAKEALFIINNLEKDDLVICSISGGGSAIFEVPYEDNVENEVKIFKALTKGGATISELNTVRKHMSRVKGGQLAKHFFPATVINLVFSDVPGDELSTIAASRW
jgi:glycerate-2-kinase